MMLLLSPLLTQYGWGEAHAARGILDGLSLPHYYGWRGGPHVKIIPRQKSLHFQECHIPDLWGCLPAARRRIAPFPLSFFFESQFLVRLIIIRAHRDEGIGPPARPGPDFASLNATGLSYPRGASAAESASESRSRRTVVWASVRRLAPYGAKCGN